MSGTKKCLQEKRFGFCKQFICKQKKVYKYFVYEKYDLFETQINEKLVSAKKIYAAILSFGSCLTNRNEFVNNIMAFLCLQQQVFI